MLWRQRIEVPPSVVPYQSEWIVGLWTVGIALSRTDRQVEQRTEGRTDFLVVARENPGTVPVPVQGGGRFTPAHGESGVLNSTQFGPKGPVMNFE